MKLDTSQNTKYAPKVLPNNLAGILKEESSQQNGSVNELIANVNTVLKEFHFANLSEDLPRSFNILQTCETFGSHKAPQEGERRANLLSKISELRIPKATLAIAEPDFRDSRDDMNHQNKLLETSTESFLLIGIDGEPCDKIDVLQSLAFPEIVKEVIHEMPDFEFTPKDFEKGLRCHPEFLKTVPEFSERDFV